MAVVMKLEVVVVPVADVDRAKAFYSGLGWRLDADVVGDDGFRVIQFTPTGSPCSVIFGNRVTDAAPGSAGGLHRRRHRVRLHRTRRAWCRRQRNIPRCRRRLPPRRRRAVGCAERIPTAAAIARSSPFPTRMATNGFCKRSRRGCLGVEPKGFAMSEDSTARQVIVTEPIA